MTFLEYVCRRLLGHPSGGSFCCPYCDHNRLTVRQPDGDKPIKFRCHRCQKWGDEMDLLRDVAGIGNYTDRMERRAEMHADYLRDGADTPVPSRGDRRREELIDEQQFSEACNAAIETLLADVPEPPLRESDGAGLKLAVKALELVAQSRLHPLAVARRLEFEISRSLMEAEHMAECDDPECECICCRALKGLPPLPPLPLARACRRSSPQRPHETGPRDR
jgi:hypothetical protein